GSERAVTDGAPVLRLVDTVRLAESDTSDVGGIAAIQVAPDGSLLVSDTVNQTAHRFGRDGALLGQYGRPGRGPGEFQGPGCRAVDSSLVAVVDATLGRLKVYDLASGGLAVE